MSDATMLEQPVEDGGLGGAIAGADEATWQKLKAALGVATREEAISLVGSDEQAAALASSILNGATEDTESTALTAPAPSRPMSTTDIANALYPSKKRSTKGPAPSVRF